MRSTFTYLLAFACTLLVAREGLPFPIHCENMAAIGAPRGLFTNIRSNHLIKSVRVFEGNKEVFVELHYNDNRPFETIAFHPHGHTGYMNYSVDSYFGKLPGQKHSNGLYIRRKSSWDDNFDALSDPNTVVRLVLVERPDFPQTVGPNRDPESDIVFTRFDAQMGIKKAFKDEVVLPTIAESPSDIDIVESIAEREFLGKVPYVVQSNLMRDISVQSLLGRLRPFQKVVVDNHSFWISIYDPEKGFDAGYVFVSKTKPDKTTTRLFVVSSEKSKKWRYWYLGGSSQ